VTIIIGLSGYAQSGKDTVGQLLVEKHGFTRFAFADYLREVCCAFDPIIDVVPGVAANCGCTCHWSEGVSHLAPCCYPEPSRTIRFSEALSVLGYEQAKKLYPEFRRTLQYMGTEVVRNKIKDSFWVDHVHEQIEEAQVELAVVTDVRFENEVRAIESWSGASVWINRPGVGPVNTHISDNALRDWKFDYTITNDGSLEDLEYKVFCMFSVLV
jgi:hypothetical protein